MLDNRVGIGMADEDGCVLSLSKSTSVSERDSGVSLSLSPHPSTGWYSGQPYVMFSGSYWDHSFSSSDTSSSAVSYFELLSGNKGHLGYPGSRSTAVDKRCTYDILGKDIRCVHQTSIGVRTHVVLR